MSAIHPSRNNPKEPTLFYRIARLAAVGLALLGGFVLAALLSLTGLGDFLARLLNNLLALQTTQTTWYITRAAGWTAYLLLWLSTVWGLAVPSKILDGMLHRSFTFDFHEFISLLALGFTGLHIAVLLFDKYLPFSIAQVLFPFFSTYRPIWVGIGSIALYLSLLVTVTFYLRKRIGMRAFRQIHLLSLIAYFGAALHGLFAGTDSPLPAAQLVYAATLLTVVFLTTYWLVAGWQQKRLRPAR